MTKFLTYPRRILLASAVSLTAIACSPINAQSNLQDTAAKHGDERSNASENRGVEIIARGRHGQDDKDGQVDKSVDVWVMLVEKEGAKPHKIKIKRKTVGDKVTTEVEGGELSKDNEGNEVAIYTDDEGKKHEYKIESGHHYTYTSDSGPERVWIQEGEHRLDQDIRSPREPHAVREPRVPRAPRMYEMRIDMEQANAEMQKARSELQAALEGVEKELADINDKNSVEYEGLEIAKSAIKSAMDSLINHHFDEKKMQIEFHRMDKQILNELKVAMEDVHEQRDIIIDLQVDIQEEVESARGELREMIIKIEKMNEGEERELQIKIVEEMESAMGNMAEIRLKALKEAEDELRKSRIELEKQIAEKKAQTEKDEVESKKDTKKGSE